MKVLKQGTSFMYWTCWTTVTCIYLSMASPLSEIRLTSAFQMPNSTRNISKNGFQSFGNGSYFIQKAAKTVIDPSDEAIINLPVLTADIIIPELQKGMQNTILSLRKSLSSIQVGRASPDLLSRVTVRAYGLATPISQLATISAVGMQSLSVEPYDTSLIKSMVRAIVESDLGLSPTVDGNTIFMDIPPMNEELRMRMCKKCKTIGEDCKVSIRNVRRCSMESTKKLKYTGAIGQDEQKRIETNIQHCTDEYIKQIIDLVNKKEEEVITIGSTISDTSKKFKSNVNSSNHPSSIVKNNSKNSNATNSDSAESKDDNTSIKKNSTKKGSIGNGTPLISNSKESSPNPQNENKNNTQSKPSESSEIDAHVQSNSIKKSNKNDIANSSDSNSKNNNAAPNINAPLPILKGTLSYNIEQRRHNIRGNWSYENANATPKQRFEYLRNLSNDEDVTKLPLDGEYHGSFNVVHVHTNAKGKRKESMRVITESGVSIKFTKKGDGLYDVRGQGRNDYGTFEIFGTATKVEYEVGDLTYDIVLKKKYTSQPKASDSKKRKKKSLKRKHNSLNGNESLVPPPPSQTFPKDVVCLKGTLNRVTEEDGGPQVVHKIKGMWSGGLDKLLDDPKNEKGLCNPFDYEHRCSIPTDTFPLSGKYTGFFLLNKEDGQKDTVQERDVNLKFRKNSEGYYNVEGRGQNGFGKYTITGTLSNDNELIIFRHFLPLKQKIRPKHPKFVSSGALAAPKLPLGGRSNIKQSTILKQELPRLSLDEVNAPDKDGDPPPPMKPLENGTFSAFSRGGLKVDADGQHWCTGKWALSKEQFEEKKSSNFTFGLKSHDAVIAARALKGDKYEEKDNENKSPANSYNAVEPDYSAFPLDSDLYYGSFRMKRGSTKVTDTKDQQVVDKQIVLKFRKNSLGSYNVYGLGVNEFGKFDLLGVFLEMGEGSGKIELYRIYHPAPNEKVPIQISGKQLLTPKELSSAKKQSKSGQIHKLTKTFKEHDSDSDDYDDVPTKSARNHFSPDGPATISNSILPKSNSFHVPQLSTSSITPHPVGSMGSGLLQRSSTRQVKVPSRLEDDNPKALHTKIMEGCAQILRLVLEKDVFAFFAQPVDALALGIPTYHDIIKNPMDLGTINEMLLAKKIESYTEFGRLVRLVFTNAMTFNEEKTHRVHETARDMLAFFNHKFEEIEKKGEKLDELLKKDKRNGKSSKEDKRRDMKGSKSRKKSKEEQKVKKKKDKDGKVKGVPAKRIKLEDGKVDGYVSKDEFHAVVNELRYVRKTLEGILSHLESTGVKIVLPTEVEIDDAEETSRPKEKKSKTSSKLSKPKADMETPLSTEEQIELTDIINVLPEDKIQGIMEILREDMDVVSDDGDVDLEIDALKTSTQRKLQRYVMQVNKQKTKTTKKTKTPPAMPAKKSEINSGSKKLEPELNKLVDNFSSDSSNGADENEHTVEKTNESIPSKIPDVFGKKDDDDSDSSGSEFDGNFNFEKFNNDDSDNSDGDGSDDDDNPFESAKKLVANESSRAEKRKISQEKVRRDAEIANQKRLKEAADKRDLLIQQRKRDEEEEARIEEEKRKEAEEARQKARDELRKERDNTRQECDLNEERDIMKEYEFNYGGGNSGSNSPSSDFGF